MCARASIHASSTAAIMGTGWSSCGRARDTRLPPPLVVIICVGATGTAVAASGLRRPFLVGHPPNHLYGLSVVEASLRQPVEDAPVLVRDRLVLNEAQRVALTVHDRGEGDLERGRELQEREGGDRGAVVGV